MDVIMGTSTFFLSGILIALSLMSTSSHAATCPASTSQSPINNVANCTVTGSQSSFTLNFLSGFNDATAIAPTGGNNGETIGEQRRLSFIKGAEILANQIASSEPIVVDASFNALECDDTSGVLGSAGATNSIAYESSDPLPPGAIVDTYYPIALVNALDEEDFLPEMSDIQAQFNSQLGNPFCLSASGWYYGFDKQNEQKVNFLATLLHEMFHGLGFASLVNLTTGAKASGLNDIYSTFLYDHATQKTWPNLSNLQRKSSAKNQQLYWNGNKANTRAIGKTTQGYLDEDSTSSFTEGDRIKMFTPTTLEEGSSVSHFDNNVSPNEIMEAYDNDVTCETGLALGVLADLGWQVAYPSSLDFYLDIHCQRLIDNDSFTDTFNGDSIQLSIIDNVGGLTYYLSYEGNNANDLVTPISNGLIIKTPTTGEFAGNYELTIKNANDETITLNINRPLRVTWSNKALMNEQSYTLTIKGATADSIFNLSQDPVDILNFKNNDGNKITQITSIDNSAEYNPATVKIDTNTLVIPESVTATISSQSGKYADVESSITVYPSVLHTITVTDSNQQPLEEVSAILTNSDLLQDLGIEAQYFTDENGQIKVRLPNINEAFTLSLNKQAFATKNYDLVAIEKEHTIILTPISSKETQENTTPKFGTGSGGSLPIWFVVIVGFLLRPSLRHLSRP